ncbi:DUF998 domain-containing protein [Umezawaea beigongshangensis]|uniref:DUF998 domain-containing protein n=1 Tax=Umezawaea beigongshangensis TaxID=2780383 RepID=UPI0027DEA6BD|nr:DUF998 domain-containing protein [Umezawaea beigongshangensis]
MLIDDATPHASAAHPGVRALALSGALAVVVTVVMIGAMDLRQATESVTLLRRTISQYALGPQRWVFDSAVLLLAAGSAAILAALVHRGLARWRSGGAVALLLWSLGLVVVVLFPKNDWSRGGDEISGHVHRFGSLLAFVSLPVAALLLARPWLRDAVWGVHARWSFGLGAASVVAFSPLLLAIVRSAVGGTPWWRLVPLGYVERALVLVEVMAVLAIGVWAVAACARPKVSSWPPGTI